MLPGSLRGGPRRTLHRRLPASDPAPRPDLLGARMDLLATLRRQLHYDAWANREVLTVLEGAEEPPEKALRWFAHILAAERLWLDRLRGEPSAVVVWPEPDLGR